ALRPVEGDADVERPVELAADGRSMRNGLLTVAIADDGTLRLEAADGTTVSGVGRIVDGGDYGDSYNYAPPETDAVIDAPGSVSVSSDLAGPVRGRITVSRTYEWPRGVLAGGSGRTTETEPTEVITELELRAGEPFVRVDVGFVNHADDHRVRFHAPLPRRDDRSHAEGQFAVVERGLEGEGGYREEALATYPAHGWIDAGGLAVLLAHLSEYELTEDGAEVALTLLRSTGLISRNDNPYRLDPAGPEMAIPNAQMRGPWRMRFALYPHAGGWADGGVAEAAERFRHDLLVRPSLAAADAPWPPDGAGEAALALDGEQVVLSSLRRRDDGWLEARIVNLAPEARAARLSGGLTDARDASLRGEPGEPLVVTDGALALRLRPAEIRTIQLRRRETALGRATVLDASGPRQNA
ncbi:MAG: alpha-mannosidase, partial [Chloroflexota bacterium]|nr:alpha-mannosidase [Chloroflexota bacterium]